MVKTISQEIIYTCPMHPEILSSNSGICSKCGMNLVRKDPTSVGLGKYFPLIIIIGMIFLVAIVLSFRNYFAGNLFISGRWLLWSEFAIMTLGGIGVWHGQLVEIVTLLIT